MKVTPIISENPTTSGALRPNPINQTAIHETSQKPAPIVMEPSAEEKDPFSQKYAELARREKIYRSKVSARESELKAREEALKAKEAEYGKTYIPKAQISEMFRKDPYQAMKEYGVSGDEITQALLNQPSPQDQLIQQLKSEIAELRNGQESFSKSLQENEKKQIDQALFQIKSDVKSLVESHPDFEIIKTTGSEDAVVEYIQKQFDETGVLVSIDQAAMAVENQMAEELLKYAQLTKIQEKLGSLQVADPAGAGTVPATVKPSPHTTARQSPPPTTTQAQPSTVSKTLSNQQFPSAQTEEGRRARAIAMMEGRL